MIEDPLAAAKASGFRVEITPKGAAPMIQIPNTLAGCRFIKVRPKDKGAIEPGWQETANYAHDDPRLRQHLTAGGNYGVMPVGGVCILDADEAVRMQDLLPVFLSTFTVRTGGEGPKFHIYFRCSGLDGQKIPFYDPETGDHLGEIYGSGCRAYVVGPGSIHPSGRTYEIASDGPLKEIPIEDLDTMFFSKVKCKRNRPAAPEVPATPRKIQQSGGTITDRLGLRCEEFLMPTGATRSGEEIVGGHPIHGSETGTNLAINFSKNAWTCRRCNSGGGPLEALAVAEGIIQCQDAGRGCLRGHWPEVFKALEARGYEVTQPPQEGDPDHEITLDIAAEALDILESGDPLETLRDTFETLHSGDREVIDTIAVAVGSQCCVSTQGVQPALTGSKGTGKTSGAKAAVHLIPREYLIEGTFSNKALFYADLKPGMVLFSDDTTLNNEMTDLIKRCMSSFQEETEYRTVDSKLQPRVYTIPPRSVFLFTSLGDQGDDQLNDRQFKIGVEVDDQADAAYEAFLKRKAIEGEQDYPVSRDVLVCRAMIREVKRHLFKIRMPFFRHVAFEDRSNRRIMRYFTDFVAAVAALRFAQRERSEPDEDSVITLTATVADMRTAANLFKTNEDTRKFGLTKEELRLWHVIASRGGEIGEDDLIELCGKDGRSRSGTRTHVRRLLYGRTDRGVDEGGLLGKVPGATVRKEVAAGFGRDGETVRRQRNLIVIKARPDISLYSGFYRFDEDAWKQDPEYIPEAV
ncbi:MAG: hypothetical protein CVV31_09210 [Methanomicrobiales archaeon HGW-Methanomicrobiales-2]|jgi:hypothetical protein|nr:MAG: hypothetical protein CVV31_09210 [Methanomicrobiales archaeon HGW-Methanomicrobiales-2]